ncbi:hypothetical protein J6590_077218 [Homalodisca vitripennis]|nr:hypothetical protein J6590_077218 [Homalodisca vitripennis]
MRFFSEAETTPDTSLPHVWGQKAIRAYPQHRLIPMIISEHYCWIEARYREMIDDEILMMKFRKLEPSSIRQYRWNKLTLYRSSEQPPLCRRLCSAIFGYELGHLTFWALPREDLTGVSGLKCIESYLDPPSGKCASGHVIYHFSNGTSIVINYTYYDEGNGHIKEFDESGNEFNLYFFNIDNTSCYYRCVTSKEDGWSFAGVAVSIGTQDNPVVADAVAECKKKIEIVGIPVDLVDLTLCASC